MTWIDCRPLLTFACVPFRHFLQRDLKSCEDKYYRLLAVSPGDWRVHAGLGGCKYIDQFITADTINAPYVHGGSIQAASTVDLGFKNSYAGQHMESLLKALNSLLIEYPTPPLAIMIDHVPAIERMSRPVAGKE